MDHQETETKTPQTDELTKEKKTRNPWFWVFVLSVALTSLSGAAVTISETYHKDRVFHGVWVGPLDLGGYTRAEAKDVLSTWHDQWWADELQYTVLDEQGKQLTSLDFYPLLVTEDASESVEFVQFDLDQMLWNAYQHGRDESIVKRIVNQISLLANNKVLEASIEIEKETLIEVLQYELESFETHPVNAGFELSKSGEPILISESQGNTFDYEAAVEATEGALIVMNRKAVEIHRTVTNPTVHTDEVKVALESLTAFEEAFPVRVAYLDPRIDFERYWNISFAEVRDALSVSVTEEGESKIALQLDGLESVIDRFESIVNSESNDAKFSVGEGGKVEQFQPSQQGYEVNHEQTLTNLNDWIYASFVELSEEEEELVLPVQLAVNVLEAKIPTGEVNDLGITEVLGVGYSDFSGSPSNRVHNISVGASKLNGLLIEPGEEFSLVQALKPFTYAEGYLPELVIKGDKIEAEIGGGLCQIGSTTFRAAMKSGLPIVERRNHSLVVNYYNDPRNGKPGTDATIYDSSPDFKFKNDTESYILIETEMNKSNGDLFFTFWGTSDGRAADYSEPIVHRWIGTGPTKIIETTDLAPGQKKCQGAHPGAETSFTYSVTRPDGEVEETVYTSSYRPLPTICLLGVDPDAPIEGEAVEGELTEEVAEESSVTPLKETTTSPESTDETSSTVES
jgi:vancomycin resistance protein YoaR